MIDYNEIYEILRKEKYSEALQPLSKGFIAEVSEYLNSKKDQSAHEDSLFEDSVIKSKKQLENSIAIFKELIRIRKKKLLNLSFVATETGIMKRDYENMLDFEKAIFDSLVKAFEQGDKSLSSLLSGSKDKTPEKFKMIIFNQNTEPFVDMFGNLLGPFTTGEVASLEVDVAQVLVGSGKAAFVDE